MTLQVPHEYENLKPIFGVNRQRLTNFLQKFDGSADAPHSKRLTHPGGQFLLDFL